jgi:hypothetical protein
MQMAKNLLDGGKKLTRFGTMGIKSPTLDKEGQGACQESIHSTQRPESGGYDQVGLEIIIDKSCKLGKSR